MKHHMGLASVGYRDFTELVLKWQHSLGVSDCTIVDRISKLAYIQKTQNPTKQTSMELQRLVHLFVSSHIFTLQCMVLH